MILYAIAALACIAALAGHGQHPELPKILIALGPPLYVHVTRGTRFRFDVALTTLLPCIVGIAAGLFTVTFLLSSAWLASATSGLVFASVVYVARSEVPVGIKVMNAILRGRHPPPRRQDW